MDIEKKYKIWAWCSWAAMIAGFLTALIGGLASAPEWVIYIGIALLGVGIVSWIIRSVLRAKKNMA